jgi:hypothetical protein
VKSGCIRNARRRLWCTFPDVTVKNRKKRTIHTIVNKLRQTEKVVIGHKKRIKMASAQSREIGLTWR